MMKKTISALLAVLVMCCAVLVPFAAFAADKDKEAPSLVSISFSNAKMNSPFSSDVMNYTITLKDNKISPVLEKYKLKGECELFVNYIYDEANHQVGIIATVEYATGSAIYTFNYANPAEYEINSNNNLAQLSCNYAELEPALNEKDTMYKLYIPSDLTRLVITPVTEDINAYCAPVDLTLSEGQEVDVPMKCIASDGSVREYIIRIRRVEKTLEQVRLEMEDENYVSFVEGTRFYEKPAFIVLVISAAGGIIILVAFYRIARKIALNPYDKDEKPFFEEK